MLNFFNKTKPEDEVLSAQVEKYIGFDAGNAEIVNNKKLWNPKKFLVISILFSFLPASIMYSINCKRLGNNSKAKKVFILSFIGFIAFVIGLSVLPGILVKGLAMGINMAVGGTMMKGQLPLFKEHISRGGKKASFAIPLVICITLTAGILALAFYGSNIPESKLTFSGDEIYYTSSVTKDEVNKLGKYLVDGQFFQSDDKTMSVKLDKNYNKVYILSLIIDKQYIENEQVLKEMSVVAKAVSSDVFNNSKVEIDLCDNKFSKLKVVNP